MRYGPSTKCYNGTGGLIAMDVYSLDGKLGYLCFIFRPLGRRGGLMVSELDSGSNGPGSSPGRTHRDMFLGKTLYSHSASLHPGQPNKMHAGSSLALDKYPTQVG